MALTGSITSKERSPGMKFMIMLLAGFLLSIPLLTIYLLNYDRQSRSTEARASIAEGWGGAQTLTGPVIVVPYTVRRAVSQPNAQPAAANGVPVVDVVEEQLIIEPELVRMNTVLKPERRKRSIYESVVYQADHGGKASFVMPDNLTQLGVPVAALQWSKAKLSFGLSDVQGLAGSAPSIKIAGKPLKLRRGASSLGEGFHGELDATSLQSAEITADFSFGFRGNGMLSLKPRGTETEWAVKSTWQSPSFKGLLPNDRKIGKDGFSANWKAGGLALGGTEPSPEYDDMDRVADPSKMVSKGEARVDLFEPVDIYNQVDRATKYGFLFIGFTFVAFLMFDVIGGARVSLVEYLLVGAGLVMFFLLLLAMAEVTGFAIAYLLASGAIIGLITAYSAAILKSWGRSKWIGALLAGLYATLYVLLSLEGYSLLIGSLMLFAALATIMYLTRNIDWGAKTSGEETSPALAPAQVVG
jgi:inner membrane protein